MQKPGRGQTKKPGSRDEEADLGQTNTRRRADEAGAGDVRPRHRRDEATGKPRRKPGGEIKKPTGRDEEIDRARRMSRPRRYKSPEAGRKRAAGRDENRSRDKETGSRGRDKKTDGGRETRKEMCRGPKAGTAIGRGREATYMEAYTDEDAPALLLGTASSRTSNAKQYR
jgi:hypothetical protein